MALKQNDFFIFYLYSFSYLYLKKRMLIKGLFSLLGLTLFSFTTSAQKTNDAIVNNGIDRPKLVVGIVIDQMRWDYLYRYYNRYSEGGFKRLLKKDSALKTP
ncbi:MAG: hypothetical protein WKF88_09175 [Ferruginibacter sp.]